MTYTVSSGTLSPSIPIPYRLEMERVADCLHMCYHAQFGCSLKSAVIDIDKEPPKLGIAWGSSPLGQTVGGPLKQALFPRVVPCQI